MRKLSPLLEIGVNFAIFSSSGNTPCYTVLLQTDERVPPKTLKSFL